MVNKDWLPIVWAVAWGGHAIMDALPKQYQWLAVFAALALYFAVYFFAPRKVQK